MSAAQYAGGKMPAQRSGQSETVVGTPWEFIRACEARWGPLYCDLAATDTNHKAPYWLTEEDDAFSHDWADLDPPPARQPLWLNPPYDDIGPWAERCALESQKGARILFLVPASVGASWFRKWVVPYAESNILVPRLAFEGHHKLDKKTKVRTCGPECLGCQHYPKDLVCAAYGFDGIGGSTGTGFRYWDWKAGTPS